MIEMYYDDGDELNDRKLIIDKLGNRFRYWISAYASRGMTSLLIIAKTEHSAENKYNDFEYKCSGNYAINIFGERMRELDKDDENDCSLLCDIIYSKWECDTEEVSPAVYIIDIPEK